MHVLVIGRPKFPVSPEELPTLIDGSLDWHERHAAELEVFGTFVGGGGFLIADVDGDEKLNELVLEMPFARYSDVEVLPFRAGVAGLLQIQRLFAEPAQEN